ncbi:MAG TPA: zinc-ribbon and DUF3426 domain-containing protein [Casimicrobiaceae bacterium]|jgi:predicted Zn finger-like uncharacterized protein|nr:zinc-ribbon and DUF3426 domain-containing protein [Casimicrobiaceae bacterium]
MAEEKFTRCPGCRTIFRVTSQQLTMRGGQVRCGHCHTVFDGVAALLSLAPRTRDERNEPELDEAALGPPTVTLRNAHALEPAPPPEDAADGRAEPSVAAALADAEPRDSADAEPDYAARFSWQEKRPRRWLPGWVYATAVPVLVLLLAGQAMFHFRDAIAAHWPATKPTLIKLCLAAGCEVRPLQEINGLSIEASDLQADPAHKGLLILTATIRNRTPYPLAYPYLELTLSDVQKQTQQDIVVVRRAFAPKEYLSGAADLGSGLAGNAELNVKLFIDASATTQAGYQVYLFYP